MSKSPAPALVEPPRLYHGLRRLIQKCFISEMAASAPRRAQAEGRPCVGRQARQACLVIDTELFGNSPPCRGSALVATRLVWPLGSGLHAILIVIGIDNGNCVGASEPAREIDIRTAARTERAELRRGSVTANRANWSFRAHSHRPRPIIPARFRPSVPRRSAPGSLPPRSSP